MTILYWQGKVQSNCFSCSSAQPIQPWQRRCKRVRTPDVRCLGNRRHVRRRYGNPCRNQVLMCVPSCKMSYRSTVIRHVSSITAKEWIDRALITCIKIELKHTDKSVAQISDDMNFPNPSFFSKFFKRETGMTPLKYREES